MAIGFGLGLGLQGTPKDYVDLVKSREAAKAKAAAAKQAKDQTAVQRLYEKWTYSNKDRSFLPIQQEPADVIIQGVLDTFDEGLSSDTPNYTEIYRKVAQAQTQLNNFVAQKKYIDEINQDPYKRGFTPQAMQVVTTERDPERFAEQMSKVGVGFSFDKNSRNIGFAALTDFPSNTVDKQLEGYFQKLGESAYDPREIKAVNDVKGTRYEYYGLAKQAKDGFMSAALQNPGSRREFEMMYQSNNPDKPLIDVTTPDGLTAFNDYLNNKYDTYTESKLTSKSGRAEYVPPALPKEQLAIYTPVGSELIDVRNKTQKLRSFSAQSFQGAKSIPIPNTGLVTLDQFLPTTRAQGTLSSSRFDVFAEKDGRPLITTEVETNGELNDNIKLKVGVMGNYEQGDNITQSVVSFSPATAQSIIQTIEAKEQPNVSKAYSNLVDAVDRYNKLPYAARKVIYKQLTTTNKSIVELMKGGGASERGEM